MRLCTVPAARVLAAAFHPFPLLTLFPNLCVVPNGQGGATILHVAVEGDSAELVDALIAAGVSVDKQDSVRARRCVSATLHEDIHVFFFPPNAASHFRFPLAPGKDDSAVPSVPDGEGAGGQGSAEAQRQRDGQGLQRTLQRRSQSRRRTAVLITPYSRIIGHFLFFSVSLQGMGPLHAACRTNSPEVLKLLIEAKVNVNDPEENVSRECVAG